jgi:Cytochrome P460
MCGSPFQNLFAMLTSLPDPPRMTCNMNTKILLAVSLMCLAVPAQQTRTEEPRYAADGQLIRPDNYREWIYLSSGLGMTYGVVESAAGAPSPRFDNVFVTPQAYKAFLQTGAWPDKTMFALEVRNSATKGSINNGGHYQEGVAALEIHLKDQARFPATKWAFFGFEDSARSAKPFPSESRCQTCHAKNGAVDETFVQFYPTLLPVAKAKGTLKAEAAK